MIMKFHYMVDQTKVEGKENLSDKIKTQISYRILNYNSYQKYLHQLERIELSRPIETPPELKMYKIRMLKLPSDVVD